MKTFYRAIGAFLLLTLILSCASCSKVPEKSDYYGSYTIIKIQENGIILNIRGNGTELNSYTLAQIELSEELYVSAIDRNGDYEFSDDEVAAVPYSFHVDTENNPYLQINNDKTPVYLLREKHFSLLLKKIDDLGNETIIYLE